MRRSCEIVMYILFINKYWKIVTLKHGHVFVRFIFVLFFNPVTLKKTLDWTTWSCTCSQEWRIHLYSEPMAIILTLSNHREKMCLLPKCSNQYVMQLPEVSSTPFHFIQVWCQVITSVHPQSWNTDRIKE